MTVRSVLFHEALAHYGVLGMKWGVRRDIGPDGKVVKYKAAKDKVSKEEKAKAKANMKEIYKSVGQQRFEEWMDSSMSQKKYSSLSTDDVAFKKGKEFYRVTTRNNETLRDITYVSTTEADRMRYRAIMPDVNSQLSLRKKAQLEYTYEATKKLVGPSEKARVDAFIELLDAPVVKYGRKEITGREYLKKVGHGRDVKKLESQELGLKMYRQMSQDLIYKNPLSNAYLSSLREKGYNVVADDNDRDILTDEPLILLDPRGTVKRMGIKQLSNAEMNKAKQTLSKANKFEERAKEKEK